MGRNTSRGTAGRVHPLSLGLFIAGTAAFYLWVSLLLWVSLPVVIVGVHPFVITSGSMSPAIRPGDVVLVQSRVATDLAPETVISFHDPLHPQRTVTHRIVDVDDEGRYVTRGDANDVHDPAPVPPEDVIGVGRFLIPLVGRPLVWLRNGQFLWLALWLVAAVVAVAGTLRPPLRPASPSRQPTDPGPPRRRNALLLLRVAASRTWPRVRGVLGGLVLLAALIALSAGASAAAMTAATGVSDNDFAAGTWGDVYYLHNAPAPPDGEAVQPPAPPSGPTTAIPVMVAHPAPPTATALYAYSTDVTTDSGRWLSPSSSPAGPGSTATWMLGPTGDLGLDGDVAIDVWVLRRGGGNAQAVRPLQATLTALSPAGTVLWEETATWTGDLDNNRWVPITITIPVDRVAVPREGSLRLALTPLVQELALAYDTVDHPAAIRLPLP